MCRNTCHYDSEIRHDKNIKGIFIEENEHEIAQYADNTEIMLEGDKNSRETTVKNH